MNKQEIVKLVSIAEVGLNRIEKLQREGMLELVDKKTASETAIADLKTGEVIVEEILSAFGGNARILVEETAPQNVRMQDFDFIVDPIDCTRGFLHNIPGTGTAIAVISEGRVVASVIGQIVATSDRSMFLHDILCGALTTDGWQAWSVVAGEFKPVRTSSASASNDTLVCVELDAFDVSRENFRHGLTLAQGFMPPVGSSRALRMFGSSSFGFVLLARGSVSIMSGSRKPWDFVPGIPLILGSGGNYFFYEDPLNVPRICAVANQGLLYYAKRVHYNSGMKILEIDGLDSLENIPSI